MTAKKTKQSLKYTKASLGPARCGADISNGSERGEYVPMRHVFSRTGRPHRAVNIMFTYYPNDKGWPKRAEDVMAWKPGMGQWDLPYDNYFPLTGPVEGNCFTPFYEQCRDIRQTGADVHFTLTLDCKVPKAAMKAIARSLVPFGRVFFRINHECNGAWFQHNTRFTYGQVGSFFRRFHDIVKEEAPLVQTVLCINGMESRDVMRVGPNELGPAVECADVIGIDRYMSLFYGWPNPWTGDPATFYSDSLERWWGMIVMAAEMVHDIRGDNCGFTLPEINADADADGERGQAKRVVEMYDLMKSSKSPRISAATFYQYRDRGGLGLEKEDPIRRTYERTMPVMNAYKRIIADPHFTPSVDVGMSGGRDLVERGVKWSHSEKADGIGISGVRPRGGKKMRVRFDEAPAIVWCDGVWQFVEDGEANLDVVVAPGASFSAAIFYPPRLGVNSETASGWADHYHHRITAMPIVSYE